MGVFTSLVKSQKLQDKGLTKSKDCLLLWFFYGTYFTLQSRTTPSIGLKLSLDLVHMGSVTSMDTAQITNDLRSLKTKAIFQTPSSCPLSSTYW